MFSVLQTKLSDVSARGTGHQREASATKFATDVSVVLTNAVQR